MHDLNPSNRDLLPWHNHAPAADYLNGKVILVTGAGSGLGRCLSMSLASFGATVLLLGRRQKPLEQVYDAILKAGYPRPALLPFDLENALAGHYDQLAEVIGTEFGQLHALINNAAILGTRAPIENYDMPTWCRVLQVNLTATFALTQSVLPLLHAALDARVVFSTCDQGVRGTAYFGAYAVAKAGLERFAEVLADEQEGRLAVHCVDPGPMHTNLRALVFPAEGGRLAPAPESATRPYLWLLDAQAHSSPAPWRVVNG